MELTGNLNVSVLQCRWRRVRFTCFLFCQAARASFASISASGFSTCTALEEDNGLIGAAARGLLGFSTVSGLGCAPFDFSSTSGFSPASFGEPLLSSANGVSLRSEEHTSELQSPVHLVC